MKIKSIKDFVHKYKLKKTTSSVKFCQVLSSLSLNDVGIFLRVGPFSSDIGVVSLHPSKGTHWVVYMNENYLDSYVCRPPNKLTKFIKKRNGRCSSAESKLQGLRSERDSYCAALSLYITYLTKVLGLKSKSAALNLNNQRFSEKKWHWEKY